MSWSKYYDQHLTVESLLGNLYGQREYLGEISRSGAKSILEVGTGSGGMAIFLSWLGFEVTSIDIEQGVLDKAQQEVDRLNGKVSLVKADGFKMPFKDQEFDLIIHQGLLEHFSNQEIVDLITEQLRVAKRVLFSVPNHLYMRKDFGNERLMDKAAWEQILSPFKVEFSKYYSPKYLPKPFLPRAQIQYMALVSKK